MGLKLGQTKPKAGIGPKAGPFDVEPELGLKLGQTNPKIPGTVPTDRHTRIPNDSGPMSGPAALLHDIMDFRSSDKDSDRLIPLDAPLDAGAARRALACAPGRRRQVGIQRT